MTLVFIVTEIYVALSAGCAGQIRTQLDYCETNIHPLQVYGHEKLQDYTLILKEFPPVLCTECCKGCEGYVADWAGMFVRLYAISTENR